MEYMYELRIPKERVAVLIGTKGETKKEIEEQTKCKLDIDSNEGDIKIMGKDTLDMLNAQEIIKAIGRGFNPDVAFLLLNQNYTFEIINILDYVGKSKKSAARVKGRVIGTEGKARRTMEEITNSHISVYGKTISIIGESEYVPIARRAIESLLGGSPHSIVYAWLEKQRKNMRFKEII